MYKLIIIMHWQMVRNVANAEARSDRGQARGKEKFFLKWHSSGDGSWRESSGELALCSGI
jgi:hypothetical protein